MMYLAPVNLLGDVMLIANRAELEKIMNETGSLTRFQAEYLDAIVTEQNKRKGIQ